MTKEQNEFKSNLKPYHIILLACLLSTVLIINSNHVNNERDLIKLNQEKTELFNRIIHGRMLVDNSNSEEVCSRASDDLKEYYKTGDLSKIDLENQEIECEDKDKTYMQALIDLVKEYIDSDGDEEDSDDTLRNLEGDIDTNKIIDYGMRILPMLIFLVISFLSIFGWIICCICTCCDCCCCCCCKKIKCKVPCFTFTYVFYALVVAVCVYGLTQATKIFTGLANTECSMLKFFDQVLYGEIKEDLPKWAGINNIKNLLGELSETIDSFGTPTFEQLDNKITDKNDKKTEFKTKMKEASEAFCNNNVYNSHYVKNYRELDISGYKLNDEYIYDLVYNFGKYEENDKYTENSFLFFWNKEFSIISQEADDYLDTAINAFKDILKDHIDDVKEALNDGKDKLNDLTKPFENANDKIGNILADYSESIDEYGKMGVNIVFSVLMVMNIALAVLMLLIYLFSMRSCAGCCCVRCLFKCCTHILWNVLALMMILSFLIGSIVALVGRVGGDMMSLVSYIMSKDNFNSENGLILGKLGGAKNYIYRCIHDDGDIAQELGLGSSLGALENINSVESNITSIKDNFTDVTTHCRAHGLIESELNKRKDLETETFMIPKEGIQEGERNPVSDEIILNLINNLIKDKSPKSQWSINGDSELDCSTDNIPEDKYYFPKKCKPIDRITPYNDATDDYLECATIVKEIYDLTDKATSGDTDSIKKVIDGLKEKYKEFLQTYINILEVFEEKIKDITNLVRRYSGNGNAFSFLNGKFIGTNLQIILKYLKYSLGKDFYTVGICLILVGCSLILSICSTILLLIIINIELKQNMTPRSGVSPYQPQAVALDTPAQTVSPNY